MSKLNEITEYIEHHGGIDFLDYCVYNDETSGVKLIKEKTNCTDIEAKQAWDILYKEYGVPENNFRFAVIKAENTPSPDPRIPHCPYCGSTSIQAVRRNWSFMRGFATNKIDRVCLNCGKKL